MNLERPKLQYDIQTLYPLLEIATSSSSAFCTTTTHSSYTSFHESVPVSQATIEAIEYSLVKYKHILLSKETRQTIKFSLLTNL